MTEDQHQQTNPTGDHDSTGWVILGAVLIAAGFFLGARNLGIVPWPLGYMWDFIVKARVGIGIVLIGVVLIWWSQSGRGFSTPKRGTRLYRSRDDKWLAGVLGGLADYFGVDVTLLRLAFIALVVLFDVGGLIAAYIVLAIVVPQAPKGVAAVPAAPVAWPQSQVPESPGPAPEPPAPVDETSADR
ncbi:MAG: PspC domain-containing protein [Coriobacteriia bacterium]|nr:PspC domain-containing protein [Coriobacteriia bacterium]